MKITAAWTNIVSQNMSLRIALLALSLSSIVLGALLTHELLKKKNSKVTPSLLDA